MISTYARQDGFLRINREVTWQTAVTMSIIDSNSPFLGLPSNLQPTQRAFIEGIRLAIEVAGFSCERLYKNLYLLAMGAKARSGPTEGITAALLDSWSIVDSIHRLRELVHYLPNMNRHTPKYKLFRKKTADVENLRNAVQHLRKEIPRLISMNETVWGTITWFTLTRRNPPAGRSCTIIAGSITPGTRNLENPCGRWIRGPVDLVSLHAYGISLSLTECIIAVAGLAKGLEESMAPQFEGKPTWGADMFLCVEMEFHPPDARETPDSTGV